MEIEPESAYSFWLKANGFDKNKLNMDFSNRKRYCSITYEGVVEFDNYDDFCKFNKEYETKLECRYYKRTQPKQNKIISFIKSMFKIK